MLWHELYPGEILPEMDAIAEYMGGAKPLWLSFCDHVEREFGVKPRLTHSVCSGKPGWNIKYQKSGKTLGTFYPEEGSFSVLIVLSDKLAPAMEAALPRLSPETAKLYRDAGEYMKTGVWMMMRVDSETALRDLETVLAVKMAGK